MFTGVYIIFLISAQKNIDCGYSLEPPRRGDSNEYSQSMFWTEIWKVSEFLSENFHFLVVKFSIYLNRLVFVMPWPSIYRSAFSDSILTRVSIFISTVEVLACYEKQESNNYNCILGRQIRSLSSTECHLTCITLQHHFGLQMQIPREVHTHRTHLQDTRYGFHSWDGRP